MVRTGVLADSALITLALGQLPEDAERSSGGHSNFCTSLRA